MHSKSMDIDSLFPGHVITVYPPDHLDAVELIMLVGGKDRKCAHQEIRRLPEDRFDSFKLKPKEIPGENNKNKKTYTIHFRDAIELIMNIPGKTAKQTRQQFANIITRYFAGDSTLIAQIEANSESDNPINRMARETVKANNSEEADSFIVGHKRRLLELEIEERIAALTRTRQETALQEKERTMALTLQGLKSVTDLSPMGVLDERSRLMFKDLITNLIMGVTQPAIISPPAISSTAAVPDNDDAVSTIAPPTRPSGISNFLTISAVAASMGHTKLTNSQLQRIGLAVSRAYFDRYGCKPSKHDQFVDGAVRQVCTYEEKDRDLIEASVRQGIA